jgi:hypothetical protein
MFLDGDGLFDEMPKIFGDSRDETYPSMTNVIPEWMVNAEMNASVRHSDKANERELTLGFQDSENPVTGDESDPWESRRVPPSWEGVRPLRASIPVAHE